MLSIIKYQPTPRHCRTTEISKASVVNQKKSKNGSVRWSKAAGEGEYVVQVKSYQYFVIEKIYHLMNSMMDQARDRLKPGLFRSAEFLFADWSRS